LDRGYQVDVVDLLWFGNTLPQEVQMFQKDIFALTEEEVAPYDQVIFLAGLSNDPMAEFSPSLNFIANASAPSYLAYICKRAGVKRFIYAGSCSVYGYSVNELNTESSPAVSNYPYGISKLQGEQAALMMMSPEFSVICFRKGTVSGYSPRMRLDLIVNTMFKSAMVDGEIYVSNPSIWRPILSLVDCVNGYIRAVEANPEISGVFNLASGNYTVGEVGDLVREGVERRFDRGIRLRIGELKDFRNYKVTAEKATNVLSFKPQHDVSSIVEELADHWEEFKDVDNPSYYNIRVFKELELARSGPLGAGAEQAAPVASGR
jgi:nucleoside-diphosphate-sugar epimerase